MYDKSEQNNEILKLFFERFPTQTIKVGLGKGIRPMFDEGLDFVPGSNKKESKNG